MTTQNYTIDFSNVNDFWGGTFQGMGSQLGQSGIQSFIPPINGTLANIQFSLYVETNTTYSNAYVQLYSRPSGNITIPDQSTLTGTLLSTSNTINVTNKTKEWKTFTFSNQPTLVAGNWYYLKLSTSDYYVVIEFGNRTTAVNTFHYYPGKIRNTDNNYTYNNGFMNYATQALITIPDTTAPNISVSGVSNITTYNHSVIPTFSASDAESTISSCTATLNGTAFTSGTTINTSGTYSLVVSAINSAGLTSSQTVSFTIVLDTTAPNIITTGISANGLYNHSVTPVFSASDPESSITSCTATLNGTAFISGTAITENGTYTFVVTAINAANLTNTQTIGFAINTTGSDTTTKARIQVGTTSGGSDKWDSGDIIIAPVTIGNRCEAITYSGLALQGRTVYYVRMAFLDNNNALGEWSLPVQFKTGWGKKINNINVDSINGVLPDSINGI